MALANYTDLKATLASWLHKDSLTALIPDFIELAEADINADCRLRLMESDESVTLTIATRTIALPSRYIEPISLELVVTGEKNTPLEYHLQTQLPIDPNTGSKTRPRMYAINGDTIEFPSLADATYSLTFRMLKGLDLANTATNSVMTNYPGLYLYGAAMQAAVHLANDARVPTWEKMYDRLLSKVKRIESRTKSRAALLSDHPRVARTGRHNIYTDG